MKINKELFETIAEKAANTPRLRMNFDLRDSENEEGQRMLNVLLPGTKIDTHRHKDTSEVVICIYGTAIERFYDDQGNQTEVVEMKAGEDTPGVWIPKGVFHSLEPLDGMCVIMEAKAGKYSPISQEDIINK